MRVVIADDSPLIREGIQRLLTNAHIDVCDQAADAEQLLASVEATRPDAAIIDIKMPPTHTNEGLAAAAAIRARYPATAVLVLSRYVNVDYALALLTDTDTDSASGYLLKERIT
jgi:DNA-binding NarL/FixJ family response regulator